MSIGIPCNEFVNRIKKLYFHREKTIINFYMIQAQSIELNDPVITRSAAIAKALGHPARIAILKLLAQRTTCFCGDITEVLPLAQSTVSQHLKALKSAGLITGEVEGIRTCYCLNPEGIKELESTLSELSSELINKCC
jgi:DNA-binding transcriptional ArsR family regulator